MMYLHNLLHTLPTASPTIIPEHEHGLSILPIQAIIARQTNGNTTLPESLTVKPSHTIIPAWQITVIVMGSLIFISVLAILFLRIRAHYRVKHAASTAQFGGSLTGDGVSVSNSRRKGNEGTGDTGKRDRVVGETKVQIRRFIKKTRPSGLTQSMEMSPNADMKAGLSDAETKRSSRKNGVASRIRSDDLDSSRTLGRDSLGRGPFYLHAERYHNSHSFVGTGSNLTSIGREADVDHVIGNFSASQHGIGPGRGRTRTEDEWEDDTHSVAHTIRDSFDEAHDQETATSLGTSGPMSASPFTSLTRHGDVDGFSSSNGHSYTLYGPGCGSPWEQDLMDVRRDGCDRKRVNRI
jgi:hypothetical protein